MFPAEASRATIQSIARTFPQGVALVTAGRPAIKAIAIQNRDNKAVFFWHGVLRAGVLGDGVELPLLPSDWTSQQQLDAVTFVSTYGEKIDAGAANEPVTAHAGRLYSCVPVGTAICHVKEGT